MKTKVEVKILNRWNGSTIFVGHGSILKVLQEAIKAGADLGCADLRNANLRGADLESANLRNANLESANLRSADLGGADLESANLRSADLGGADLGCADLRCADLRNANLRGADLGCANLRSANLESANLRSADLGGADLGCADLRSADLGGADLGCADLDFSICPEEGDFIGFKRTGNAILKLKITGKRTSSIIGRKCRASKVEVLAFKRDGNTKWETKEGEKFQSGHNSNFIYIVGKSIEERSYDGDIRVECTKGIHFFITEKEAREYT